MNEPNSILEFLGILVIMGVVMAVVITLFIEGKEKLSNIQRENKNNSKVFKDSNHLMTKSVNHKDLENYKSQKILIENSFSELDKTKLFINYIFYDFCFNIETAKMFLVESKSQESIIMGLLVFQFESEKLLEKVLKIFFRKKYGFELGEGSYNTYRIDGFKFYIDVHREYNDDNNSYFDILYNDFEDVVDEQNNEVLIAKNFIVYCKDNFPKAIFVLVYDPILEVHFVRRVYEDGKSIMLTKIIDAENYELITFLEEYVLKL
ncbi:hypothetical protein DI487_08485 [Flavobacterium sediminis]|uniref:Uncharacterized protein n=1 Tax=Flavobacterium sediminis TaxID=2201181 RepID=A0A2U8QVS5_9FLAO|nr:hypothetical protein [Flavobacterium sediminis]AWM13895.1 hypothetical protein DI487_08485 [Flavobacterium sediminis]